MTASARRRRRGGDFPCRSGARVGPSGRVLAILSAVLVTACSLLQSPERSYVTNRELLEATSKRLGFEVDPEQFTVVAADLRDDVITLQYTGKAYPGDQAWVMRFSEKSTEQDSIALSDVHPLVRALSDGRRRFAVVESGERAFAGDVARYLEYTFESPLRGATGEAFVGRGFLVVLRRMGAEGRLVYQIKLDNYGDRDELVFADLEPLLAPLSEK